MATPQSQTQLHTNTATDSDYINPFADDWDFHIFGDNDFEDVNAEDACFKAYLERIEDDAKMYPFVQN